MNPRSIQPQLVDLCSRPVSSISLHGAEADLVLNFRNSETWVVEIKRSSAPTVSKGFHLAAADVGATRKLLIAPVATSYPIRDGIEVMSPLTAVRLLTEAAAA